MTTIEELQDEIAAMRREMLVLRERVQDQGQEIGELSDKVASLMITPSHAGTFPPLNEVDRMQVQIFHNDMAAMTLEKKKGGSKEYVVKIEYWHRGTRQAEAIRVPMLAPAALMARAMEKKAPAGILTMLQGMVDADGSDIVGGMVRRRARGGTFDPEQVIMLLGQTTELADIKVMVVVGEQKIIVDGFRLANGTHAQSARWFASWKR